jgi:ferritin-like metal-binding protein YciE
MGLFTKDIKTMKDLFVHQLQDIYYAEKQLVKALAWGVPMSAPDQSGDSHRL